MTDGALALGFYQDNILGFGVVGLGVVGLGVVVSKMSLTFILNEDKTFFHWRNERERLEEKDLACGIAAQLSSLDLTLVHWGAFRCPTGNEGCVTPTLHTAVIIIELLSGLKNTHAEWI